MLKDTAQKALSLLDLTEYTIGSGAKGEHRPAA